MRRKGGGGIYLVGALLLLVVIIGLRTQNQTEQFMSPVRARYSDASAVGGKGFGLMLQRLGYTVNLTTDRLEEMPADAKIWIILDPKTYFSKKEAEALAKWVKAGGTLIWAVPQTPEAMMPNIMGNSDFDVLSMAFHIEITPAAVPKLDEYQLPQLLPLMLSAASIYRTGVSAAVTSSNGIVINGSFLEVAGTPAATQLAMITIGKGRVFLAPDATMFCNLALSHPDNAVLASNLVRVSVAPGAGAVYFDEREHSDLADAKVTPNLLYYLWRPPVRYAVLQLLCAGLLLWGYYGRRLGAPVPFPEGDPVTRAGHFAMAMGQLFEKARRPGAAATIVGENFRRTLTRRLGMSVEDADTAITARAAEFTGLPAEMIDRLLLAASAPSDNDAQALSDVQEMEIVLRRLNPR